MRILENYTYNDTNDEFEREPMVVLISDMTVNRMYLIPVL